MNTNIQDTTTKVTEGYKDWTLNRTASLLTTSYFSTVVNKQVPVYTLIVYRAPVSTGPVEVTKYYKTEAGAKKALEAATKYFYNPNTVTETR